jgi:hypothetical protein
MISEFRAPSSVRVNTNSTKDARLFAVTVPYSNVAKKFAFDCLDEICEELLISEESHVNGKSHHHLYLKTCRPLNRTEVKTIIKIVYNLNNPILFDNSKPMYVQTVRNARHYLSYITKEDCNPIFKGFNIRKKLSFYFRALEWAKSQDEFDISHPFILNNPQFYRLLERVHSTCKQKEAYSRSKIKRLIPVKFVPNEALNWHEKVLLWWNDWSVNGHSHKKKQLYLFGPSNVGKTSFINRLVRDAIEHEGEISINEIENQVFRPAPNEHRFAWQSFDHKKHNLIIIDEFQIDEYNTSDMKRALAGESFVANSKYGSQKTITPQIPVILISNYPPPAPVFDNGANKYEGFHQRLNIIQANEFLI